MDIRNVVIMGSGVAGHTAALYSARANLKPLVIEGHEPGGQLSLTTLVENFPGFPEGIQGPELIENMHKQAARFGAEYRMGHVVKADLNKHPFELSVGKETIQTRTLIVASGASARWLGLPADRALGRPAERACADRPRCFFLRYLRWLLFLGQGNRGDRRRRLRHGRSDISDALREQGDTYSPSRAVSRFENHARSRPR